MGDDAVEQREGAVVEFHDHALEGGQGGFDFDEVQDDGLVRAEHGAGGDAEKEGITDLTGGTGDCDTNRAFHRGESGGVGSGVEKEHGLSTPRAGHKGRNAECRSFSVIPIMEISR